MGRRFASMLVCVLVLTATLSVSVLAADTGYYRRVISKTTHSRIEGYITLPTAANLAGIDVVDTEAAYNYFGLSPNDGSTWPEFGLFTAPYDSVKGYYVEGVGNWMVFWNAGTPDGWHTHHWPTKASSPAGSTGPNGGIPGGTRVYMKLSVPTNGTVVFYVSYTYNGVSNSMTQSFLASTYTGLSGVSATGYKNKVKRLTTLVVTHGGSYSKLNTWSGVSVGTAAGVHEFTTFCAESYTNYPSSSYIQVAPGYVLWSSETCSIVVP